MRNILITGASTGIGRATAVEFGKDGANIALVARRKSELEKTKKLVEEVGGKAEVYAVDLSSVDAVNSLINSLKKNWGKVDVIVNIAGIWHGEDQAYSGVSFSDFSQKVVLDTYAVGLTTPTLLVHALASLMPQKSKVINLSGTFTSGAKGWLPYYVSKRALEDFTVGLAEELKDKDIQVNCVSPSDVATEAYKKYFPKYAEDVLDPKEVAEYIVHLTSPEFDNTTGKVFTLKKGQGPQEGHHA